MSASLLEAQVRESGGVAIVDLRGEINAGSEQVLNEAYAQAHAAGPRGVLLNFAGVEYINSTGIALIVGLLAQARKAGKRLMTSGLSEHYVEIFKITRLSDFMSIYPDESTALAEAAGQPAKA